MSNTNNGSHATDPVDTGDNYATTNTASTIALAVAWMVLSLSACIGQSPQLSTAGQGKVVQQTHAGASIVLQSAKPEWAIIGDVVIDVTLTNGTKRDMSLYFADPQQVIKFEITSPKGQRVSCDSSPRTTSSSINTSLKAGASMSYKARLKDWHCPDGLTGVFRVVGIWQIADMSWPADSSIADSVKSEPITITIGPAR